MQINSFNNSKFLVDTPDEVKVFLLDPDPNFCKGFQSMLGPASVLCETFTGVDVFNSGLDDFDASIVLISSDLVRDDNVKNIRTLMNMPSSPEVVVLTKGDSLDIVENAIINGAWDCISKPCSLQTVLITMRRALAYREKRISTHGAKFFDRAGIVGNSSKLEMVIDAASKAANCQISTLLLGETGTGKELFARAIHSNSARGNGPFVVMDCTNIPETLTESTLFGHVKGAFTGATESREGLFSMACGGTIFLDEVGELELPQQRSLLRVLQEQVFRPVGSSKEIKSDFRLIAATNRDLSEMVEKGDFRQDLFYRLKGLLIEIPPLRERVVDVGVLIKHYLAKICREKENQCKKPSKEYLAAMNEYSWPGNVRELVNAVYYSCEMAEGEDTLLVQHLPLEVRLNSIKSKSAIEKNVEFEVCNNPDNDRSVTSLTSMLNDEVPTFKEFRRSVVEMAELEYFSFIVGQCNGAHQEACSLSGLSKARLYELLKRHKLSLRKDRE